MTKARDLANASTALSAVSATELAFVDGVTSAIQTQLDAKATLTGTETLTNKTLTSPVLTTPTISTVNAKGDLLAGTADNTVDRLAVGNSGEQIVADSSTSTGLRYNANFAAGKNKIINGDFSINQRSFTTTSTSGTYGFDRWVMQKGGTDGTCTYTPQTFTAGTAPVAGYEATNFARLVTAAGTASNVFAFLGQRIEDVRTYANQTITVSFWAKAASGTPKIAVDIEQYFGSGGSTQVNTPAGAVTISTSWARYSVTVAVPTISGTTIGAGNYTGVLLWVSAGSTFNTRASSIGIQNNTFDVWGVQSEIGSVATAFQTATGTLQGELAACQRYYYRQTPSTSFGWVAFGLASGTTAGPVGTTFPVQMRVTPTAIEYSTLAISDAATQTALTNLTLDTGVSSSTVGVTNFAVASGLTAFRPYYLRQNSSSSGYLAFTAEL